MFFGGKGSKREDPASSCQIGLGTFEHSLARLCGKFLLLGGVVLVLRVGVLRRGWGAGFFSARVIGWNFGILFLFGNHLVGCEEFLDFVLEGADFAERDLGILDDEDFTGGAMLVDAQETGARFLGIGFDEELFALQHDGKDVAGVLGMGFVFFDEASEKGFGIFLVEDLDFGIDDRGFVDGAPEGEGGLLVFAALFPGARGKIEAEIAVGLRIGKESGEEEFVFFEGLLRDRAVVRAGFDVPGIAECHVVQYAGSRGQYSDYAAESVILGAIKQA